MKYINLPRYQLVILFILITTLALSITGCGSQQESTTTEVEKANVSSQESPAPSGDGMYVRAVSLNIFEEPDFNAPVAGSLKRGSQVVVETEENGWCQVSIPEVKKGWVPQNALMTQEEFDRVIQEWGPVENWPQGQAQGQGQVLGPRNGSEFGRGNGNGPGNGGGQLNEEKF